MKIERIKSHLIYLFVNVLSRVNDGNLMLCQKSKTLFIYRPAV